MIKIKMTLQQIKTWCVVVGWGIIGNNNNISNQIVAQNANDENCCCRILTLPSWCISSRGAQIVSIILVMTTLKTVVPVGAFDWSSCRKYASYTHGFLRKACIFLQLQFPSRQKDLNLSRRCFLSVSVRTDNCCCRRISIVRRLVEALVVLEDFADNFVDLALVSFGVEFIEDFLDICDNFTDEESRWGILPISAKVVLGLSDCLISDARRFMCAAWVLFLLAGACTSTLWTDLW